MNLKDDKRITAFLNSATRLIKKNEERESVREELYSHIEEAVDDLRRTGLSLDESIERALIAMGEGTELALGFDKIYRAWYRHPAVAFAALALVVSFIGATGYANYEFNERDRKARALIAPSIDQFFSDQQRASAHGFFEFSEFNSDAGPYLNDRIAWDGYTFEKYLRPKTGLALPAELLQSLKGVRAVDVKAVVTRAAIYKLDFSWMTKLDRFDHWDTVLTGPIARIPAGELRLFTRPVPDYFTLQTWSRLRLQKGVYDGNLSTALNEVRQLARLIYTSEFVVATRIALKIVEEETEFVDWAIKSGHLKRSQWSAIDRTTIDGALRASWAMNELFDMKTDEPLFRLAFEEMKAPIGLCAAVSEGVSRALVYRPFFSSELWGHERRAARFGAMSRVLNTLKGRCRLSLERKFWADTQFTAWDTNYLAHDFKEYLIYEWVRAIPMARRVWGELLYEKMTPQYFTSRYPSN